MAFRAVAVAMALTACASACSPSSADRSSGGATGVVPTEPPRTTTTNPYAVPAVIDVAYVNRVLAGLDAAMGDVTRLLIRTKTFPPEAFDRLKAIYATNDLLKLKLDGLQSDLERNFVDYKSTPGNKVSTVTRLLSAAATCIFVQVSRDFSAVTERSDTVTSLWVALRPLDVTRDPKKYNLTSWALAYDGFQPDRSQPPNPCSS